MGKRINQRLTSAEYVSSRAEDNSATHAARRDLFTSIRRKYPQMLRQFLDCVFPEYEKLAKSGFNFFDNKALWYPGIPLHTRVPDGPLKSKLEKWAQKFNASEGWFLDEILRTLHGWYVAPDWRESLRTNPIGTPIALMGDGEPLCFSFEHFDPQLLPEPDYRRKAREGFEQKLSEHIAAGRKRAESFGLIRAPRQYSSDDLDFFVLYQFVGMSSTQIADCDSSEDPPEESAILKRVRVAARLLGWSQLRNVPRGRPKTVTKPRKSRS